MEDLQEQHCADRKFEEEYHLQESAIDDAVGLCDADGSGGSLANDAAIRWYVCESACVDSSDVGSIGSGGRCGVCGAMGEYAGSQALKIYSISGWDVLRRSK